MPILIDFSGTVHAAVHVDIRANRESSKEYLRHLIINQLRSIRKKFVDIAGEPVICMDSKTGYWRRDKYPFYKAKRKEIREASSIDWNLVFSYINEIAQEIRENLPYKILQIDKAEADDIIGTLVLNHPWDPDETCMIVSNDHDFKQLHGQKNTKQYFPFSKKIERVTNPDIYLLEHILKGDAGDGVPNVRSESNIFILPEKKRQLPVTTNYIKSVISTGTVPESDKIRLEENTELIDLRMVPGVLKSKILSTYSETERNARNKLFPYLVRNDLNYLLEHISDF